MKTYDDLIKYRENSIFKNKQISKDHLMSLLKKTFTKDINKLINKNVHITVIQNPEILYILSDITREFYNDDKSAINYSPTVIIVSQSKKSLKEGSSLENNIAANKPSITVADKIINSSKSCGLKSIETSEVCTPLNEKKKFLKNINIPDGYLITKVIATGYAKPKKRLLSWNLSSRKA